MLSELRAVCLGGIIEVTHASLLNLTIAEWGVTRNIGNSRNILIGCASFVLEHAFCRLN